MSDSKPTRASACVPPALKPSAVVERGVGMTVVRGGPALGVLLERTGRRTPGRWWPGRRGRTSSSAVKTDRRPEDLQVRRREPSMISGTSTTRSRRSRRRRRSGRRKSHHVGTDHTAMVPFEGRSGSLHRNTLGRRGESWSRSERLARTGRERAPGCRWSVGPSPRRSGAGSRSIYCLRHPPLHRSAWRTASSPCRTRPGPRRRASGSSRSRRPRRPLPSYAARAAATTTVDRCSADLPLSPSADADHGTMQAEADEDDACREREPR